MNTEIEAFILQKIAYTSGICGVNMYKSTTLNEFLNWYKEDIKYNTPGSQTIGQEVIAILKAEHSLKVLEDGFDWDTFMASQGADHDIDAKPSKEALNVRVTKISEFHGNYTIELSNGRTFTYRQQDVTHY